MLDECRRSSHWINCLDCKFLHMKICPLEGDTPVDRIVSRIKMIDDLYCSPDSEVRTDSN